MKIIMFSLLVLLASLAQTNTVSASTLGFSQVGTSNSWDVVYYGANVTDASRIVVGYDLDVTYNASPLVTAAVTFNSLLGNPADTNETWAGYVSTAGLLDFWNVSVLNDSLLFANQQGITDMTLARLTFTDSVTNLAFTNWNDGSGYPNINDIKGPGFNNIIYNGPVPEPGTLLLLGSGLAALVPFRRRLGLGIKAAGAKID